MSESADQRERDAAQASATCQISRVPRVPRSSMDREAPSLLRHKGEGSDACQFSNLTETRHLFLPPPLLLVLFTHCTLVTAVLLFPGIALRKCATRRNQEPLGEHMKRVSVNTTKAAAEHMPRREHKEAYQRQRCAQCHNAVDCVSAPLGGCTAGYARPARCGQSPCSKPVARACGCHAGPTCRLFLSTHAMAFSTSSTLFGAKKVLPSISSSSHGLMIFQTCGVDAEGGRMLRTGHDYEERRAGCVMRRR